MLKLFHILTFVTTAVNIRVQTSLQDFAFISFGDIPKSGMAGSYGDFLNEVFLVHLFPDILL